MGNLECEENNSRADRSRKVHITCAYFLPLFSSEFQKLKITALYNVVKGEKDIEVIGFESNCNVSNYIND